MTQQEAIQKKNDFTKKYFNNNKNIFSIGLGKTSGDFTIVVGLFNEDKSLPLEFDGMRVITTVSESPKAF